MVVDLGRDTDIGIPPPSVKVTSDYAGLLVDAGSSMTIDVTDAYNLVADMDADMPEKSSNGVHASDHIVVGATAKYHVRFDISAKGTSANKIFEFMVFVLAASGSTLTSTNEATPCSIAATAHGFVNGNLVRLAGISTATALNDRIFTVTRINDNTFTLQDDEGVDINATSFGTGSGGTATLATKTVVNAHRKWAAADVGAVSAGAIISLIQNKILQLYVKNLTDATNVTVEHCTFYIQRVN